MGVIIAQREPGGASLEYLLLLVLVGIVGFTLALRWPASRWGAFALIVILASQTTWRLLDWFVGVVFRSATYMRQVHIDAAIEAGLLLLALVLPFLAAETRRLLHPSASRPTTRRSGRA